MRQFRDSQSFDFFREDTAKNPVIYPARWASPPQKSNPSIPHLVGVIVISLASSYALIEAGWLLVKAFIESVR